MDTAPDTSQTSANSAPHSRSAFSPPFDVQMPDNRRLPLIFNSPHSGAIYPSDFIEASKLDPLTLRRSEDSFVDELFSAAPSLGAPLMRALFPRAYLDPNREAYELDPSMFDGPLPKHANIKSIRVAGGLGTIARVVCDGHEIYAGKLSIDEAHWRIDTLYRPYHQQLDQLIEDTHSQFGLAVLIDCHSMPSIGGPMDQDTGHSRTDIVLGDVHGRAASRSLTKLAENYFRGLGLNVNRNTPYAGGFITQHYGRPAKDRHTLQIEINRALYMDEVSISRSPGFEDTRKTMTGLIEHLKSAFEAGELV